MEKKGLACVWGKWVLSGLVDMGTVLETRCKRWAPSKRKVSILVSTGTLAEVTPTEIAFNSQLYAMIVCHV